MIYRYDDHGVMRPSKRVRKTLWVHPDRPRGVAYRDTGEDTTWLRERGYERRVCWVVEDYVR